MMHRRFRFWVAAFAAWSVVSLHALAAPPVLNYFFPSGALRGSEAEIAVSGTFDKWPVSAWVDRRGVTVEASNDRGKLKVTVAGDAQGGVYWIRLYNEAGATALRPFVVDSLPEVVESEPNNEPTKPQQLAASSIVNGKLAKAGDVDVFAIELAAGQTVVASMQANETLGSPMDAVLQLCSPRGFVLKQCDDERGTDPLVVFKAPAAGAYLVRTFAFPATPNSTIGFAGADNFVYRLTVTTGGFLDHALPMSIGAGTKTVELQGWNIADPVFAVAGEIAPSHAVIAQPGLANSLHLPVTTRGSFVATEASSPEQPQLITLPTAVAGRIELPGDVDTFRFSAKKGQKLSFRVESRELGFPLDPVLKLSDAGGKVLSEVDDNKALRDPVLSYTAPADGEFDLSVGDLHDRGGFRYVYRLVVEEAVPDYSLSLAAGSFSIKSGETLEIPVTVNRQGGFAEEIEVGVEGLPEGVSAEPVKSLAKGGTAKTVKLKLIGPKPAVGEFKVVGRSAGDSRRQRVATFAVKDRKAAHNAAWLTVLPK